jgi:hypothetical protein
MKSSKPTEVQIALLAYALVALVFFYGCCLFPYQFGIGQITEAQYESVKPGMTRDEVRKLLGSPMDERHDRLNYGRRGDPPWRIGSVYCIDFNEDGTVRRKMLN